MAMHSTNTGEGPQPLEILTCMPGGNVRVHHDALQRIFCHHDLQDKPVCIVSISGAFRKGKSFMLNFFIRYLRNKGHTDKSWMGDKDVPMMDGFDWKGGREACTNGILVWSEVFTVKRRDEEVAVLLMDTQGLFETRMGQKVNSIIFALSTLISSVQIFNVTHQIQENDLGFLQFFTAYAQAARKESSDKNIKPFQSLIFLIRDWPHAVQTGYGSKGGEKYLEEVLSEESTSEELSSVRKHLRTSFDKTKCCLMPYPGRSVAVTSFVFDGCLRDIDEEFLHQTASFVDSLFHPQNLVVKTINGRVVSAPAILQYITDCSVTLTSGKLPDPKTMMENVAEAQNFEAQRLCREEYTKAMKELTGKSFVATDFLQEMHSQASDIAKHKFMELTRFGSDKSRKKHRDYLETTISREYRMIVQANQSLKADAESAIINLIQAISFQYEENMRRATDGKEFITDNKLETIHGKFWNEACDAYSRNKDISSLLKDEYFPKLQERLDRIYQSVKRENTEKQKIAEEKNEQTKKMMKAELEYAIQYREKMRERVERYSEQRGLNHECDSLRRTVIDKFQLWALEENIDPSSDSFKKRLSSLDSKLGEEYQQIMQINKEKKEVLEKSLENYREKAIVDYETAFKMLLKDSYMENEDLRKSHQEIVQKLMISLRQAFEKVSDLPIVKEHLLETESKLGKKYSDVEKWNEKNNSFFRKCFKVLKSAASVAKDVLGIVATVGAIKMGVGGLGAAKPL